MKFLKKNIKTIILGMIFTIGVGLLAYPTVADWWNKNMASHAIADYNNLLAGVDTSEYDSILESARDYNAVISSEPARFTPGEELHKRYEKELSINDTSLMGTILIPEVDISLPVYHGTTDEVLGMGAGHLEGSSLPIGGLGTHSVITGHRGLPSAKLFTDLDKVEVDDYIILKIMNEQLTYQVDQIRIVLPSEVEDLKIEPDQDLLTLVTCTPYGINSHRILITGHRVENLPEDYNGMAEGQLLDSKFVAMFIAIPILIGLFIWLLIRYRKPKDDEDEN